jgi:hypothetical protein
MFEDVSNTPLAAKPGFSSSLFDDAYNSVSSSLRSLKETVAESPYASAAIGLAATAGLLYLTRGKIGGAAAKTDAALIKLSTHSQEARTALGNELSHSPVDPELLARIRAAAKGEFKSSIPNSAEILPVIKGEPRQLRVKFPDFSTPPTPYHAGHARILAAAKRDLITVGKPSVDPTSPLSFSSLKKDSLTVVSPPKHLFLPGSAAGQGSDLAKKWIPPANKG